ncbi:hypothetical protein [Mumia zhuanghuii]|uniref:Uncharacterized protein n=1 Tax=Mumia zhuanghuii TaxID=2585211 RepID=A0A5C4MFZ9_9ACTN|nr:hypothetical protein [Mumia zhuanghuii]TNC36454.1 hypothetical protein FHE65_26245 [Mumia zhuanghuii]
MLLERRWSHTPSVVGELGRLRWVLPQQPMTMPFRGPQLARWLRDAVRLYMPQLGAPPWH